MMRKYLLSLLYVLSLPVMSASVIGSVGMDGVPSAASLSSDTTYNLVVWLADGRSDAYPLSEHPVLVYQADKLCLSTQRQQVEYAAPDVKKFTMTEEVVEQALPVFYLTTWLHNGRRDAYPLSEHPVITYRDNKLLISTHCQTIEYAASDIRKFTLTDRDESCDAPLLLGDVNLDGKVNVVDVSSVVSILLRSEYAELADVNHDGNVNVVDVSSLINIILTQSSADATMALLKVCASQSRTSISSTKDVKLVDGVVAFAGCKPYAEVMIYDADGALIATYRADAKGALHILVSDIPTGTYIIKSEAITHKIIRK